MGPPWRNRWIIFLVLKGVADGAEDPTRHPVGGGCHADARTATELVGGIERIDDIDSEFQFLFSRDGDHLLDAKVQGVVVGEFLFIGKARSESCASGKVG